MFVKKEAVEDGILLKHDVGLDSKEGATVPTTSARDIIHDTYHDELQYFDTYF